MNDLAQNPVDTANRPAPSKLLLCVVLCLAGLATYRHSFTAPFLFDDLRHIVDNHRIRSLLPLEPLITNTRRPLLNVTLAANYALGGLDVRGYHAFNLVIHLAAGLTLFGLVRRTLLLPNMSPRLRAAAPWLALTIALVWLVHPLQTQAVTYTVQRLEAMMGLFFLLCLYCLVRGDQARRGCPWYLGSLAACWLGMGAKEVMAMAPLVALLYDRTLLANCWGTVLRRRGLVYLGFVPALVWLGIGLRPAFDPNVDISAGIGVQSVTMWEYFRSQPGVILHYLRLAFWPDRLCLDYAWPIAQTAREIVLPGLAVTALLLASLAALRWWPKVGFLGISFFLILAPTSSFMPIADLAFEHRMYLPLACVVVLTVLTFHWASQVVLQTADARRLAQVAVIVMVVFGLMVRTSRRNQVYQDDAAMWADVVATAPHNPRGQLNLGNALWNSGQKEEGVRLTRLALELNPNHPKTHNSLAVQLAAEGKVDEAISHYERAIAINPRYARAYDNYGNLYARQERYEEAIALYQKALEANPHYAPAHLHLGLALCELGRDEEAVEPLRAALRLDPGLSIASRRLAIIEDQRARAGRQARGTQPRTERNEREETSVGDGDDFARSDFVSQAVAREN